MPSHAIVLYATSDCAHCEAARALLVASGQPFDERNPLATAEALKELLMWSAVASVPTVVVSGQVMVGFDADRLQQLLDEPPPEPTPEEDDVAEELRSGDEDQRAE